MSVDVPARMPKSPLAIGRGIPGKPPARERECAGSDIGGIDSAAYFGAGERTIRQVIEVAIGCLGANDRACRGGVWCREDT